MSCLCIRLQQFVHSWAGESFKYKKLTPKYGKVRKLHTEHPQTLSHPDTGEFLKKQYSPIYRNSLLSGSFLIKFSSFFFVAQWLERPTSNRKTLVKSPAGLRCVFSSDPTVGSSVFGREKSREFDSLICFQLWYKIWQSTYRPAWKHDLYLKCCRCLFSEKGNWWCWGREKL